VTHTLAPYACWPSQTRGRRFVESPAPTRTDYQRDRDRIVHSTAFRRLVYKTQVFLNHEGDLFRTRMTHSLEVAQIARSVARALALNEDLVEAIALAHDLGHTPFGHAGQEALNDCMSGFGGFEHNLQSLRVVDHLEERYPHFDGLNLTFETREGVLKHCALRNAELLESQEPHYADGQGGVARRFLDRSQPSLEAQLCNLADEIAYNAHDIDDGVRSGLIDLEQLQEVELFDAFRRDALQAHPQLAQAKHARRLLYETIRLMLSAQVYDVIRATQTALLEHAPASVGEVRRSPALIRFGPEMKERSVALKTFLFRHLYRHPQVESTMATAKQVVRDLFRAYSDTPLEMQSGFAARTQEPALVSDRPAPHVRIDADPPHQRVVADYIAGMTDRFAAREHERLTGRRLLTGSHP